MIFLLLFLLWPFAEIILLIQVGSAVGIFNVLMLCILGAAFGTILMQWQGLKTPQDIRQAMSDGKVPVQEIFDTFCIFISGFLLIIPGFISDLAGLVLLLPFVRHFLRQWLGRRVSPPGGSGYYERRSQPGNSSNETIIEGEFTRMDDPDTHLLDEDKKTGPQSLKRENDD